MKKLFLVFYISLILLSCTSEKVHLKLWITDTKEAEDLLREEVEIFTEKNPKIYINILNKEKTEMLKELKRKKLTPDIIRIPSEYIEEASNNNKIKSLNNILKKDFFELFLEEAINAATINKNIYGIPDNYGNHMLLFYNKSVVGKGPGTTKRMISIAKYWESLDTENIGLVCNLNEPIFIQPWWDAFEANILDENNQIKINTRQMTDCFRFLYDLKYTDKITPQICDYSDADTAFKEKKAAMIINGDWAIKEYKEALDKKLRVIQLPTVSDTGKPPVSWASTRCYSINKRLRNKKLSATKKIILHMTSEDTQKKWLTLMRLPSLKSFENNEIIVEDPLLSDSWSALLTCKAKPENSKINVIFKSIRPILNELMNNKISPQNAVVQLDKYLKKLINSENNKK